MATQRLVGIGVLLLAILVSAGAAAAGAKFPARPVELIVPAAPGGGTDILARILAEAAEPFLGQKVVVINKAGGSGTIGLHAVTEAAPDGHVLGCVWNSPLTMVPNVLKVKFTPGDYSYVTLLARGPMLFAVRTEFPAKTAAEFFDHVGKNPAKYTYAGDGVGNIVHFSGERVFQAMKVKLRFVPFGGAGESIKALLGGHVDVYGGTVPPAAPHIKADKVRPLFVTSKERVDALPTVPSVRDLGKQVPDTYIWPGGSDRHPGEGVPAGGPDGRDEGQAARAGRGRGGGRGQRVRAGGAGRDRPDGAGGQGAGPVAEVVALRMADGGMRNVAGA
jgi:tripartite-type tricarboxylate transporter receptor subunit TctC